MHWCSLFFFHCRSISFFSVSSLFTSIPLPIEMAPVDGNLVHWAGEGHQLNYTTRLFFSSVKGGSGGACENNSSRSRMVLGCRVLLGPQQHAVWLAFGSEQLKWGLTGTGIPEVPQDWSKIKQKHVVFSWAVVSWDSNNASCWGLNPLHVKRRGKKRSSQKKKCYFLVPLTGSKAHKDCS